VGQAILPAAGFQAGLLLVIIVKARHLKGGCSQNWLPH